MNSLTPATNRLVALALAMAVAACAGPRSAGSTDKNISALLNKDGGFCWNSPLSGEVHVAPLYVVADKLFVLCDDGNLYAIDTDSGNLLWKSQLFTQDKLGQSPPHGVVFTPVAIQGWPLFVATSAGDVFAVDEKTGAATLRNSLGIVGQQWMIATFGPKALQIPSSTSQATNHPSPEMEARPGHRAKTPKPPVPPVLAGTTTSPGPSSAQKQPGSSGRRPVQGNKLLPRKDVELK